jgi:hypothetical protein
VQSMNFPVPNFCLDHRFVRLNYARFRRRALLKSYNSKRRLPDEWHLRPMFRANTLHSHVFFCASAAERA